MVISSAIDVARNLWPVGGRILDIGCGSGGFVAALRAEGLDATGCDPQAERIMEARRKVAGARFDVAGAEALPYRHAEFDGCTMVHSLHHVPGHLMMRALAEALRCLRPGGQLVVIEPLAEGSFFEVLRLVDDETALRNAAQRALREACDAGLLQRVAHHEWTRRQVYSDMAALATFITSADPSRAERLTELHDEIATRFASAGVPVEGGLAFDQPIRCDVFMAPARG